MPLLFALHGPCLTLPFAVLLNQVTAHAAVAIGLTCIFPGKLLAQNGHSGSHWNCGVAGGQDQNDSLGVSLLRSRGNHSSVTLRGGYPGPSQQGMVYKSYSGISAVSYYIVNYEDG